MKLGRNIVARRLVWVAGGLVGGGFAVWILLWIQLLACFPPEVVYGAAVSPDGGQTARFSVKYEGIYLWLPLDIEPHYYITIVDTVHGWIVLRKSGFCGALKPSFSELARKHAPWAAAQLDAPEK